VATFDPPVSARNLNSARPGFSLTPYRGDELVNIHLLIVAILSLCCRFVLQPNYERWLVPR